MTKPIIRTCKKVFFDKVTSWLQLMLKYLVTPACWLFPIHLAFFTPRVFLLAYHSFCKEISLLV